MKPPELSYEELGLPKLPSGLSLQDLRWKRDIAARDGDLQLALAYAIAIDKKRGLYGAPKRKRVNKA